MQRYVAWDTAKGYLMVYDPAFSGYDWDGVDAALFAAAERGICSGDWVHIETIVCPLHPRNRPRVMHSVRE